MSYVARSGFNLFKVAQKQQKWRVPTKENWGLTGHILILFGSFFCASEFTGCLFTTDRSKKGSRVRGRKETREKRKVFSVITNQYFCVQSTISCLCCHWEGIAFKKQYPFWLLAPLYVCFNMNVFSSQQNGAVMKCVKWITKLEMSLVVFSPHCKGQSDFQLVLFCILVWWGSNFYRECFLWKLNLISYLFTFT